MLFMMFTMYCFRFSATWIFLVCSISCAICCGVVTGCISAFSMWLIFDIISISSCGFGYVTSIFRANLSICTSLSGYVPAIS